MFYERKIKYLDYLQNVERRQGAGFVKIEVCETVCNITIQVSGLSQALYGEKDVFLTDGRKEEKLGCIKLENGRGSLIMQGLYSKDIGHSGISYENLRGLSIPIGANVQVHCVWSDEPAAEAGEGTQLRVRNQEKQQRDEMDLEKNSLAAGKFLAEKAAYPAEEHSAELCRIEQENKTGGVGPEQANRTGAGEAEPGNKTEAVGPEQANRTEAGEAEQAEQEPAVIESADTALSENQSEEMREQISAKKTSPAEKSSAGKLPSESYHPTGRAVRLRESKWKQLCDIYPHIQPFKDRRDYLSVSPADFVIFPEKYYRMANNSFLLHGYYNYEHLILTCLEKRGESVYYIGVPGNFYEREKQVAVMFGFESFECMEEPAKQGDFGYYMMRLEL